MVEDRGRVMESENPSSQLRRERTRIIRHDIVFHTRWPQERKEKREEEKEGAVAALSL